MGTGGDRWLGGDDIDKALRALIYEKVANEYNINDLQSLVESLPVKKRNLFLGLMREMTEDMKIQLSSTNTASCIIDDILEDENGAEINIDLTVTREEFNDLIRPFIQKSVDLVDSLLRDINYDIEMIDNILLVGGTSCIPLVKEMLSEKYGKGKIKVSKKPMLCVAEGAAILAHRLSDEYECPNCGKTVKQSDDTCKSCRFDLEAEIRQSGVAEVAYSANHDLYVKLKDEKDKIVEKQQPLPVSISRSYKTDVNNQKIMKVEILSDIEEGKLERITLGFLTIDENIPAGGEIIFDFTLDVDDLISCKAYPKKHANKAKTIIFERGQKDGHAFETIENLITQVNGDDYTHIQKEVFMKSLIEQLQYSDNIGSDKPMDERLAEIDYKTVAAFDELPELTELSAEHDDKEEILSKAHILVEQYSSLLGSITASKMGELIAEVEDDSDILENIQSHEKLRELVDENDSILIIVLIKIAANKASKQSPSDSNKLLQMHDLIVAHMKDANFEEAKEELNKAMAIAEQYLGEGQQSEISTWLRK